MSVYTHLEHEELADFLSPYDLGQLVGFEGISAGIENTNYFIDTQKNGIQTRYVLTVFEKNTFEEMPYFINLMSFLSDAGIPTAKPIVTRTGQNLLTLKNKPAVVVACLQGADTPTPNTHQIEQIARAMANMHIKGAGYPAHRDNCRSFNWWANALKQLDGTASAEDIALAQAEINSQAKLDRTQLPSGVIHADLFKDNALFNGEELAGLIDFYFACNDVFIYDMAVTLNDWCSQSDGTLDADKSRAFLNAYQSVRALTSLEKQQFHLMLRCAALRFWLSRLMDFHFPREGELTQTKNPDDMKRLLLAHQQETTLIHTLLN